MCSSGNKIFYHNYGCILSKQTVTTVEVLKHFLWHYRAAEVVFPKEELFKQNNHINGLETGCEAATLVAFASVFSFSFFICIRRKLIRVQNIIIVIFRSGLNFYYHLIKLVGIFV